MQNDKLALLRRKEVVGLSAAGAWTLSALLSLAGSGDQLIILLFWAGWLLSAVWITLDARYRDDRALPWTLFALVTGPVALLVYIATRLPVRALCPACGAEITDRMNECPTCGHRTLMGRIGSTLSHVFAGLTDSLSRDRAGRARHTAKYMPIALGLLALFAVLMSSSLPYGPPRAFLAFLGLISAAAYWVLLPWWVYLDASWRRMDAIPWAVLTLMTNVFGLVTYLVIRYPDPRACPQCGAYLSVGLKRCPYCGSEAEPTCPKCQSPIKTDWAYCPACAAQIPATSAPATGATPKLSVRGSVTSAIAGSPIENAVVEIDSKTEGVSAHTDSLGRFALAGLDPRPYVLVASADGCISEAKAFTPGDPGQLHFVLRPCAEQVADVGDHI